MAAAIRPSSMTLDALWTWEDLWQLPDDGNLYEIIDGELYVMAPPIPVHQELSTRFVIAFHQASDSQKIGKVYTAPIGVKLSERDIVEPDIIFIARERLAMVKDKYVDGPPDIVVEILSPSTRSKDLQEKAALYARSGVREYWQVDPRRRSVVVLTLKGDTYDPLSITDRTARSAVLPDLAVHIPALFEDLT